MSQPTMEDTRRSLDAAAAEGNLDGLYASIKEAPTILDHIDAIPFVHTPLHIAASAGRNHFAKEILNLKPALGRKLNPDGFSPLHLALRTLKDRKGNPDWQTNEELKSQIDKLRKTVKQLVKFDGELVRVRGREMFTPLHLVAQEDDEVDLLVEFLRACPASIEDVTVRDETALHIALKNSRFRAVEKLLGWLRENLNYRPVLNWEDEEGNTVHNIPASKSQSEIMEQLDGELSVDECNKKNDRNSTALDSPNEAAKTQIMNTSELPPSRPILRVTSSMRTNLPKPELSMEMCNIILVVAVLIATATYQAVLSPPGGGTLDIKNLPTDQNGSDHIINGTISTINLLSGNNITTPSNAAIFLTMTSTATTNTTTNPMKRVLYKDLYGKRVTAENYYYRFYIFNTITFVLSIMVIMLVLPQHWVTALLRFALVFLTFGYGFTFHVLVPSFWFATILLILSYGVVASVCLFYKHPESISN